MWNMDHDVHLFGHDRKWRPGDGFASLICIDLLRSWNDAVEVLVIRIENNDMIIVLIYEPAVSRLHELTG